LLALLIGFISGTATVPNTREVRQHTYNDPGNSNGNFHQGIEPPTHSSQLS
jgi:hypothetical protein